MIFLGFSAKSSQASTKNFLEVVPPFSGDVERDDGTGKYILTKQIADAAVMRGYDVEGIRQWGTPGRSLGFCY